jgi:hypothetical protein
VIRMRFRKTRLIAGVFCNELNPWCSLLRARRYRNGRKTLGDDPGSRAAKAVREPPGDVAVNANCSELVFFENLMIIRGLVLRRGFDNALPLMVGTRA